MKVNYIKAVGWGNLRKCVVIFVEIVITLKRKLESVAHRTVESCEMIGLHTCFALIVHPRVFHELLWLHSFQY